MRVALVGFDVYKGAASKWTRFLALTIFSLLFTFWRLRAERPRNDHRNSDRSVIRYRGERKGRGPEPGQRQRL